MLILQRRSGESIRIGEDIEITIVSTEGGRVRLAISAPTEVPILRSELIGAREANRDSAMDLIAPDELFGLIDGLVPNSPAAKPASPVKLLTQNEHKHTEE